MKKTNPARQTKSAAATQTAPAAGSTRPPAWWPPLWQWIVALGALFLAFEVYGPAVHGSYVLDDLYLPFAAARVNEALAAWVGTTRPLLMASYWLDYRASGGTDPYAFHVTNILLHFATSLMMTLIAIRILGRAGVGGRMREVLSIFAGALFLLHPMQTESVAYVAGRSEVLSVFFYFAAYAVFLWKPAGSAITLPRAIAILILSGAALATKEHTLTLPVLLLLTDLFWDRTELRKNAVLYGMLLALSCVGAVVVWKILFSATSAGFRLGDVRPLPFFFTECRVFWSYLALLILPWGQNVDPDVPLSASLLQHGAILGLAAIVALIAAAWIFRKRYPLAAFGVFVFVLLLAPTSSFIPIRDVLAEHRVYLPFLGFVFLPLEVLRRVKLTQAATVAAAMLLVCAVLTYQRSTVWASSLGLWQDSVAKSPNKYRPRFQLAFAQYERGRCQEAAQGYEKASGLAPVDDELLVDWALALDCAGRADDAAARLKQALLFGPSAHIYSQLGMVLGKHGKTEEALDALQRAQNINPNFEMLYVYRGNVYERNGDLDTATTAYRRALELNPQNQPASDGLVRISRARRSAAPPARN